MIITSVNNPLILETAKLKNLKFVKESGQYLVEGEHLVNEALKAKVLEKVFCLDKYNYDKVPCYICNEAVIKKLSNTSSPQGVVGVCKIVNHFKLEGNLIILDGISDPGNLGTIIRTCAAYNIKNIIASLDTVNVYNDKVIRSTQGALYKVNILYSSLCDCFRELKSNGYKIYATSLKARRKLGDFKINDKYAIVIGNEARGIREETINQADILFKIPMNGNMESLNASVAAGICIWEFTKKND